MLTGYLAGGETIKDMQAASGCKVNILPPSGRNGDREVTLWGTREAIEQVKGEIMDKVEAVVGCSNRYSHQSKMHRTNRTSNEQKQRGTTQGNPRDEQYGSTPYSGGYQSESQAPMQSQAQGPPSSDTSQQQQPPQMPGQPATGDGSDPYAAYGGYENYVAMWYAAMAAQQQQQQQYGQYGQGQQGSPDASGQAQNQGPPGLS